MGKSTINTCAAFYSISITVGKLTFDKFDDLQQINNRALKIGLKSWCLPEFQ